MDIKNSILDKSKSDLLITNGNIITVDSSFSIAEAVAVKDGKIQAVGKSDELKAFIGGNTIVVDLKGKTMLPGINDAHMHPSHFGCSLPPAGINVENKVVTSIDGIKNIVAEFAKTVKPGEWIHGEGWKAEFLEECVQDENRRPSKSDLDPVSPDNPVCLNGGARFCWVNSKALEMTGVSKDTPPPIGNELIKDLVTGELTGLVMADGKKEPEFRKLIPKLTREHKKKAIKAAVTRLNELGITSAVDGSLGPGNADLRYGISEGDVIGIYNDIHNEGDLTLRVNVMYLFGRNGIPTLDGLKAFIPQMGVHTGFGDEWLRVAGIKLVADGSCDRKSAWMHDEYIGGGKGKLVLYGENETEQYEELLAMIEYAHNNRFQVGIHANGDRAIDACVEGFIRAIQKDPWDARHYTIHSEAVTEECARRMAEFNISVNALPNAKFKFEQPLKAVLGEDRVAKLFPLRTLIDTGVHVSNSSDAPIDYPDWKKVFQTSVSEEFQGKFKTNGVSQHITREEAIRTFTIEGAWQTHQEGIKGSIEEGKLADFCILDQNILTVDTQKITDIQNLMTIVNGEIVYDAGIINY